MRWTCTAYNSDVWMLGDSYFNCGSPGRWPHYLRENGYTENYMLTGYPGRNSKTGLADFKQALTHGTPKYAIWCLGMNDPDKTAISASYFESVQEFIRLCEENGITPILSTIPNTPTMNNSYKNDWVRKSGYRYIDFARAVGAEEVGSPWYEGMLHTDNVHPSELGAKALYAQFITDFPEILKNKSK